MRHLSLLLLALACRSDETPGDTADPAPLAEQCASPASDVAFEDVADAWGLYDTTEDDPARMEQGAVGLLDVDGDGLDDVLVAPRGQPLQLQRNDGSALDLEPISTLRDVIGIAAGDVDGDGDLDLLLGGMPPDLELLLNDGDGTFTDATAAWGLGQVVGTKRGASFGDLDGDGDLDLYLTVAGGWDRLFRNDGGAFTDVSDWIPPADHPGLGWSTVFLDVDDDGDLDLYVNNADQATQGLSRLLRNDGLDGDRVRLTDISDGCFCDATGSPMGASAGDYDADGDLDLFVTNTGPSPLLRNEADGTFTDVAVALGATVLPDGRYMTFGSSFLDYDADGHLDVFTAAGPLYPGPDTMGQEPLQSDALLRFDGEAFEDVAPALGMDAPAAGRGVAAGLLDDDGFLDLLVFHLGTPSRLWRNRCTEDRILIVDLVGQPPNTFGMHARLELEVGGRVQTRVIDSNGGWGGAVHPRAHFGLGREAPERLTVTWSSGEVQEVQLGSETPARIVVEEP